MGRLVFLFWILIIPFCFGLEVSPISVEFSGFTGERFCEDVSILDFDSEIVVEDRWASKEYGGRDFSKYKLDDGSLGLDIRSGRHVAVRTVDNDSQDGARVQ